MNSKLSALAVLMAASILLSGCTSQNQTNASGEKVKVFFSITANDKTDSMSVLADKGINAFELMKANFKVDYQTSAYGPFVQGINGIKADSSNYWALYVDREYAQKGINLYILDKDTNIAWKLEKVSLGGF